MWNTPIDELIKIVSTKHEEITLLHEMYSGYNEQFDMRYIAIVTIKYNQFNKFPYLITIDIEFYKLTTGITTTYKFEYSQFINTLNKAFELAAIAVKADFKLSKENANKLREILK